MKELRNKAGDLAMIVSLKEAYLKPYEGITVVCKTFYLGTNMWKVSAHDPIVSNLLFNDSELLPLGGEHVLQGEPQPELTQGSEAEIEKEEV